MGRGVQRRRGDCHGDPRPPGASLDDDLDQGRELPPERQKEGRPRDAAGNALGGNFQSSRGGQLWTVIDNHSGAVREDAHDVAPAADLTVEALQWVVLPALPSVLRGEGGEGGHVRLRIAQHLRHVREARPELLNHTGELGGHLLRGGLREDHARQRRHERLSALRYTAEQVAHEVRAAVLPVGAGQERVDCAHRAAVVITDDELYARETSLHEAGQEDTPGGLILAREGVEAEDLTVALAVAAPAYC